MALKAGRVGVAKSEVDEYGHITGGGTPENVYTKTQCDNKFETKTHASNTYESKENIGGLKFRDNDGTAQYQLPNGDWTNFSSGSASIPTVDCSGVLPSITTRSDIICVISPVAFGNYNSGVVKILKPDGSFAGSVEVNSENPCCLLKDVPCVYDGSDGSIYLEVYVNENPIALFWYGLSDTTVTQSRTVINDYYNNHTQLKIFAQTSKETGVLGLLFAGRLYV